MRRLKKKIFLGLYGGAILLLGVVRFVFSEVTGVVEEEETPPVEKQILTGEKTISHVRENDFSPVRKSDEARSVGFPSLTQDATGRVKWHPILSVPSYAACFPDVQDVQIVAAKKWGVSPVRDREEAEHRRNELLYIGANPFYCLDTGMTHSIPYLVPRAAQLLSTIGRNYLDSLYIKGIPLHQIIVTSVLRTEADVARLKQRNGNATEQSCHLFGTTFDICYNRYNTVSHPDGPERRTVQSDTLKWVLSEVLRDVRESGMCYIKHEVKQGCFHITVR